MSENNIVYIQNVPPDCKESDLYELLIQYGPIERIKIFSQQFQNYNYPIGIAQVQFKEETSVKACSKSKRKHPLSYANCILQIHSKYLKPQEIETDSKNENDQQEIECETNEEYNPLIGLKFSVFIFFSSESVTREYLLDTFAGAHPIDITIRMKNSYDHYGLAIIKFQDSQSVELALSYNEELPIHIIKPSLDFINQFSEDNISHNIIFKPPPIDIASNTDLSQQFLNLEIIFRGNSYKVNGFLASVYSTTVYNRYLTNPILQKIHLDIDIEGPFDLVVQALFGQEVFVKDTNAKFLYFIGSYLGMESLTRPTSALILLSLDSDSAFSFYNDICKFKLDASTGPHIDYFAANVDKSSSSNFYSKVPVDVLQCIFKSPFLSISDPESWNKWLMNFIYQDLASRVTLLQFIDVKWLSRNDISNLIQDPRINLNIIRGSLFSALKDGIKFTQYATIFCEYIDPIKNTGVFTNLSYRHKNSNLHDLHVVRVSTNSNLQQITNPNFDSYWCSSDTKDSYVVFDFKRNHVTIASYMIISDSLLSWTIEGTNDPNFGWNKIESRRLKEQKNTFHKLPTSNNFRYIRIVQTGKNSLGNHSLRLQFVEFFGRVNNKVIEYEGNEGILNYINNHGRGKFKISSSSDPKYLINEEWSSCYYSPNQENSFIKFDFMEAKVKLKGYTLAADAKGLCMKSWKVEVSENDVDYVIADERLGVNKYKEQRQKIYWKCQNEIEMNCRYVKITMIGKSSKNDFVMALSNVELYGQLVIPE
ncbi:F5/8 type C domain containing protein [Histomonas meleagridis]|uniref:F5/8 type C domain containing protein n=1 Tax=Histomonas meleagridis TaxID=135588 RepID=UPI003559642B|nr:F5/8 type C domain containing protein [Histomonas meleagridis]KAH0798128.1 F5/8 type C domain containing protein [Histomonas meleagridis]